MDNMEGLNQSQKLANAATIIVFGTMIAIGGNLYMYGCAVIVMTSMVYGYAKGR